MERDDLILPVPYSTSQTTIFPPLLAAAHSRPSGANASDVTGPMRNHSTVRWEGEGHALPTTNYPERP